LNPDSTILSHHYLFATSESEKLASNHFMLPLLFFLSLSLLTHRFLQAQKPLFFKLSSTQRRASGTFGVASLREAIKKII
jgi:hypothetical protein